MGTILGLIPARGGSKGIPDKNIKPIAGMPLIDFTINAARTSSRLDDFVVSTDSQKISDHIKGLGIHIDSLRPDYLASDTAKTIDTVIYELVKYEEENKCTVDAIVLLQPTAPLRTAEDIDQAITKYQSEGQPSLISCYDAESIHPNIMYRAENNFLVPYNKEQSGPQRRQDMEPVFVRNGALYITSRDMILSQKKLISETPSLFLMPRERSVNIDGPEDVLYANFYLKNYAV